jgi:hypothetical protein
MDEEWRMKMGRIFVLLQSWITPLRDVLGQIGWRLAMERIIDWSYAHFSISVHLL